MEAHRVFTVLLLTLILLMPCIACSEGEVAQCYVIDYESRPVDCMYCFTVFMQKLLSNELSKYVSYTVVQKDSNVFTVIVQRGSRSVEVDLTVINSSESRITRISDSWELMEIIHEVSLELLKEKDGPDPICFFAVVKREGNWMCYDKERNLFYTTDHRESEYCAEVRSPADISKLQSGMLGESASAWDVATNMWDAFVKTLGAIGAGFINSLRIIGGIMAMAFQAIIMYSVSALTTIGIFISMAAPVIIAIVAWLPWIMLITAAIIMVDAFQRSIRTRSFEPILQLPSRFFSIYINPIIKLIEIGKTVFQAVYVGVQLAIEAMHTIIAIIKRIFSIILGR